MSIFILVISCLTTSNLAWFMDLTFQVPMQYCSLQHRFLLPSPVTSTTGHCFRLLFLYFSPVAYWAPTNLGSSSFNVLSFCLSYCSWGSPGKNTEVVCHSLLQWTGEILNFLTSIGSPGGKNNSFRSPNYPFKVGFESPDSLSDRTDRDAYLLLLQVFCTEIQIQNLTRMTPSLQR